MSPHDRLHGDRGGWSWSVEVMWGERLLLLLSGERLRSSDTMYIVLRK